MKTTILLDEQLYEKIVLESIKRFGNSKNISEVINQTLKERFGAKPESLYGMVKVKNVDYSDIRDKKDREF